MKVYNMDMKTIYYFAIWCIKSTYKWFADLFSSKMFRGALICGVGGGLFGQCMGDLMALSVNMPEKSNLGIHSSLLILWAGFWIIRSAWIAYRKEQQDILNELKDVN